MMPRLSSLWLFLFTSTCLNAHSTEQRHTHRTLRKRTVDDEWYFPTHHRVHRLFNRQASSNRSTSETFPEVGSGEWQALFPAITGNPLKGTDAKPEWLAALNLSISQGLIPMDIPIPLLNETTGYPIYPSGTPANGSLVCSASYFCRGADDVWDAPAGHVGMAFDDGPLPGSSSTLYAFLRAHNQTATHFFIGENIISYPTEFLEAFEMNNDDIACHTYTHPYMTTLTNEAIVAEFGWQLEVVRVSTKGRVPRYWRPPYGDVDNRVRAIASNVFGLTTVLWNHDSLDWELPGGPVTSAGVHQNYTTWYSSPKAPGLIILSHELTKYSVQAWMDTYPLIAQNGWISLSIPDLFGTGWFVNAQNDTSPIASQAYAVAQDHGTPIYSGYAEQTASLGTATHLTFTSTVVGGSTVAVTGPLSTNTSSAGTKGSSAHRKVGIRSDNVGLREMLLSCALLALVV